MQMFHEKVHWLDVRDRVTFKSVLEVPGHSGTYDPSMPERPRTLVPSRPLCPTVNQRHFCSADRKQLHVPRHRLNTYGRLAFAIAGTSAWNSLPDPVRNPNSTEAAFRRLLDIFVCMVYYSTPNAL